jgi:hypothetical protein
MTTPHPDSFAILVDLIAKKSPSYLSLLCSTNEIEFDDALDSIIEKIIDDIERDANLFSQLKEDGITAILSIAINQVDGLHATQQAHSNGHVDITIETDDFFPVRRRLGEAKIYAGPQYHEKGLEQLIQRYSTGRQKSGYMIEYIKSPGIKLLVEKIRTHMDSHKPSGQDGATQDHRIRWAFVSHHLHGSGERIRIVHLNCNLFV